MTTIPFAIVDVDTHTDRTLLLKVCEATTIWSRIFGRPAPYGWEVDATVRLAANAEGVAPGEWVILLLTHPDVPGALGYHDRSPNGTPYVRVFPKLLDQTDLLNRLAITVTHEVGEVMVNPELNRVAAVPRADGTLPMEETSDNVETFSFPVTLMHGDQVQCSAFTTPAYFEPPADLTGVPVAVGAPTITQPGQMESGSYQILYDPATRQFTQDQRGELSPYRKALTALGWGKLARLTARAAAPASP